jgi:hypothetical protein
MTASLFAISRGLIIEPPAFLPKTINAVSEWVARRTGTAVGPAQ